MNLLLISANRERDPYPVFPIGLASLVPPLEAAGHRVRVIDLCFEESTEGALARETADWSVDAVLLSVRNVDNVTWPDTRFYLPAVRELAVLCRDIAPVIVGGSGFSLMPREILEYLGADYGVVGEGELILPRLLAAIGNRENVATLPGVLIRGKSDFLPPVPGATLSFPDRKLFPVERYHREGGMANLQTKRGCPFSCIYCTYPLLEGKRVRTRPVEDVVAEVRSLAEAGINYLYFVDDIFNYPEDYALALSEALAAQRLGVSWSAFINPGFLPPRLLDAMVAAGCDAVEFGTDSGSPRMLASLGKSFGTPEILRGSHLCAERGIDFAHYILFGGPGENEDSVEESFSLMDEANPTAVIGMTGLRIFPGTPLHRIAVAEGVVADDDPLLEPAFYLPPPLRDSLARIVTEKALLRRNWVVPGLEINTSAGMLAALRNFPVRGPLWKLMRGVGRSRVRPLGTSSR